MKKSLIMVVAAITAFVSFAKYELPKNYQEMTRKKRVCVSREIVVIGGVTNVVTHWQRDGRPDWILPSVETNTVRRMKGRKQNNAIENARKAADVDAESARKIKKAAKNVTKKDVKVFEKVVKNLGKALDKSSSQEFKDLYQMTIDLWMSEINAKE